MSLRRDTAPLRPAAGRDDGTLSTSGASRRQWRYQRGCRNCDLVLTGSGVWLAYREDDLEDGTTGVAGRDAAPVALDDRLDDRQAEAAARGCPPRCIGLVETVENQGQVFRRDTGARVPDEEVHTISCRVGRYRDRATVRRVAQRVGDEVLQRLLEALRIAGHPLRAGTNARRQCDTAPGQLGLVTRLEPIEQHRDGDVVVAQRPAAALEPRQVEQVADDVLEAMCLLLDDAHVTLARGGIELHGGHR